MKKISLGEYLLYYLVKGLSFGFRLLPIQIALFIGRRCSELFMFFNIKRRRIAYVNLKAAFSNRYTPAQLKQILRKTYANIGQGLVELLYLPKMDRGYLKRYVEFENFHLADEALRKGKGLIFLTAHFGAWEMSNVALPFKGLSYKAIARQQKPYLLNELLNKYRESNGCRIILKGLSIKEVLKYLKANGIVGMLVDQDAGKTGIFTDLFDRPASWHRGVMEFAFITGATVIPGFAIRKNGPYLKFKLFEPIELNRAGEKEDIIKDGIKKYVHCLEKVITEYPEQWLWQHRRWKSTPVKNVVILDDGRTGHLRQSEAVGHKLKQIWQKKGYKEDDIRVRVLRIKFKNRICQWLLKLEANLSHFYCQGCLSCLKLCLTRESYEGARKACADIIISCGSQTAPVNLILCQENNCRSVTIMKPSAISLSRFNLVIAPKHDKPLVSKNVCLSLGALNFVTREVLEKNSTKLKERIGVLRKKVIAVFIGGPTKSFNMQADFISMVLDNIISSCDDCDCDMLLTTSRRTPKIIEELIKERLGGYKRCKLLVIANENNFQGAVEAMLGLANISLVSEESISMISEAASSGSYTVVFREGKSLDRRHEAFLENLKEKNFIEVVDMGGIYSVVSNFFTNHPRLKVLDDMSGIEDGLARLL